MSSDSNAVRKLLWTRSLMILVPIVLFAIWFSEADHHLDPHGSLLLFTVAELAMLAVLSDTLYRSILVTRILSSQMDVIKTLSDTSSMSASVASALSVICKTFGFKFAALWLVDSNKNTLSCASFWQCPKVRNDAFIAATKSIQFEAGVGLPGRVWSTAREHWVRNVQCDKNYPRAPMAKKVGYKAGFAFPVFSGSEIVGVLEFYRDKTQDIDFRVVQVLLTFGHEFGQFLERCKSVQQLVLDAKIAQFTAEIGKALTQECKSTREMLVRCTDTIVMHLPIVFARIWTLNTEAGVLELQASSGMYTHIDGAHSRIPVGKFKIGLIASEKSPHLTNSLSTDRRVSDPDWVEREGMVAFVGYPLMLEDEVVGVIAAFGKQALPSSVLDSLSSISNGVALGIRRMQADEQLAERERLLRQLTDNIREVFFVIDSRGCFTYVSPAYEELWGLDSSCLIADKDSWLSCVAPSERDKAKGLFTASAKLQSAGIEVRLTRLDGTVKWVWMRMFPTFNEDGSKSETYGIAHDITDRKVAERRVNEFYSTVSHELRTPLTSIHGSLRLMEGGLVGELPQKARDLVAISRSESERLIRLINDILDLRKLEAGKLELRREEVKASDVASASLAGVKGLSESEGVQLLCKMDQDGIVYCDRDRIIQVLENLLSNAIKYSPAGGSVVLTVCCAEDFVRFDVQDSGPGIASNQIEKLFCKFQQLDSSDSRRKGGTGLGLAITKAIVEQHEGKVGVETRLGVGSTFWFELPLTRQDDSHDIAVQSSSRSRDNKRLGHTFK